jgi:hypothetical protein
VLNRAAIMSRSGLNEDAARAAYLACFTAAQAYIFERTGKTFIQREFFRLVREDPRADSDPRRFLSLADEFKSIADYFSGPDPDNEEAAEAVETAERFVTHFVSLVPVSGGEP